MNVYLALSRIDEAGGSEEPLTVLAIQLKRLGYRVTVFCRQPANLGNQYVRRLREAGVGVASAPHWLADLAGDWQAQDHLVIMVMRMAVPFLAPVALVAACLWRRGYRESVRSIVGHGRARIAQMVHRDRRDKLFVALLETYAWFRGPDVIHVFRGELTSVLAWSARRGLASVYSELSVPGGMDDEEIWEARSEDLNKATIVTALSRSTADGLRTVAGSTRPIVIVAPVVADCPETVSSFRSDGNRVSITCVARLSPEKGLEYLLQAAKRVFAVRDDTDFLIAGGGPLLETLTQQAIDLGVSGRVRFLGPFLRRDLADIMAMTDVLVLPSLSEGMGYVILEAMAFGKPVVATNVGGIPELVDHGRTGLLVPPRDPARLADALLTLAGSAQLRFEMGQAGRLAFLEGGFSVEAFTKAYVDVYRQAQELHRAARKTDKGNATGSWRASMWIGKRSDGLMAWAKRYLQQERG